MSGAAGASSRGSSREGPNLDAVDAGTFHARLASRPRARRLVAHVDVDAFLASVEQALDGSLRGRPVIVGGLPHERNLVMSCSYEARAKGVRPGMGLWEAARRCPEGVFRKGDAASANAARARIVETLSRFSPLVETGSIDDFYVDLTGTERLHGPPLEAAERMRAAIREATDLSVTIGLGSTKTVAKVAGDLAKPGGIGFVFPGWERAFLATLPVRDLPGVGPAIQAFFDRVGVRTVGDLALAGEELLEATFGAHGRALHARARGADADAIENLPLPRSISRETTFERETADREEVEGMLFYLVERAAARARALGACARTVAVKARYADRDAGERRATLPRPTDLAPLLAEVALSLARGLLRRRVLVRLVGVRLENLVPRPPFAFDLFDEEGRAWRLERGVDRVRERHGFGKCLRGPALSLLGICPLGRDGFVLRTPSLTQ